VVSGFFKVQNYCRMFRISFAIIADVSQSAVPVTGGFHSLGSNRGVCGGSTMSGSPVHQADGGKIT